MCRCKKTTPDLSSEGGNVWKAIKTKAEGRRRREEGRKSVCIQTFSLVHVRQAFESFLACETALPPKHTQVTYRSLKMSVSLLSDWLYNSICVSSLSQIPACPPPLQPPLLDAFWQKKTHLIQLVNRRISEKSERETKFRLLVIPFGKSQKIPDWLWWNMGEGGSEREGWWDLTVCSKLCSSYTEANWRKPQTLL